MPAATIKGDLVPIRSWAPPQEIEAGALKQLRSIASLPWVAHHVAVMPDVHLGRGATVGSVIALRGAVAPAAVGVDIGCGMAAVRTSLRAEELPDNLRSLRLAIEEAVPVGPKYHPAPLWDQSDEGLRARGTALLGRFDELASRVHHLRERTSRQLGTSKAYKDIDRVMAQQEDLVEVVAVLRQVVCVKG